MIAIIIFIVLPLITFLMSYWLRDSSFSKYEIKMHKELNKNK